MISLKTRLILLVFIGLCTFIVPALGVFYLYRLKIIKSLQLETLSERRIPYFLTATIYAFFTYFFAKRLNPLSEMAPEIAIILGSITISILLVGIVSLKWQISAHGSGVGGVVGFIFGMVLKSGDGQLLLPFLAFVLITGWVLTARLHLNAHSPAQAWAGVGLGIIVSLTTAWFVI